jgi:hypothetical protein
MEAIRMQSSERIGDDGVMRMYDRVNKFKKETPSWQ